MSRLWDDQLGSGRKGRVKEEEEMEEKEEEEETEDSEEEEKKQGNALYQRCMGSRSNTTAYIVAV